MKKELPKCPECDKMIAVKDKSEILSGFVDWLSENGYAICTLEIVEGFPRDQWISIRKSFEVLFAEYFGIDLHKAEQEKQALLKAIRESQ